MKKIKMEYLNMGKVKIEMKCCPFCGEIKRLRIWDNGFGIVRVIECPNCETLFLSKWNYDPGDLIKKWNRRAFEKTEAENA